MNPLKILHNLGQLFLSLSQHPDLTTVAAIQARRANLQFTGLLPGDKILQVRFSETDDVLRVCLRFKFRACLSPPGSKKRIDREIFHLTIPRPTSPPIHTGQRTTAIHTGADKRAGGTQHLYTATSSSKPTPLFLGRPTDLNLAVQGKIKTHREDK